ncbi:hypothetical protein [Chromobacterium violaceum]|uniref:hypothetical protein n=1 Tax=Chromobacterium violaceum TaxID=536 RepID=UPI003CEC54EB
MMVNHMNPRQFKKLCAKCHCLVLKIDPSYAGSTHTALPGERYDWFHLDVLNGTKGFGERVGYEEPEWEDQSAWNMLTDMVFWHFAEIRDGEEQNGMPWASWPVGVKPTTWRDYLALGQRVALEVRRPC